MIATPAKSSDLSHLIAFREEAAGWIQELGYDQWRQAYPPERLSDGIDSGSVFLVRDAAVTAATLTLTVDADPELWGDGELGEPAGLVSKLTVARTHGGQNLEGG
ncbi:hypothetical protein [Wenjunlia tyrosinilytica]|uniref:hypothetical protein n=1 Tax=Wenjunlia tyrosinilytica TaxID=1544741 RepID=UPI00166F2DC8|nr:hypothetical protein [Wenjunlia tyrosinilytica]